MITAPERWPSDTIFTGIFLSARSMTSGASMYAGLDPARHQRFLDLGPAAVLAVLVLEARRGRALRAARRARRTRRAASGCRSPAARPPGAVQRLAPAREAAERQRRRGGGGGLQELTATERGAHGRVNLPDGPRGCPTPGPARRRPTGLRETRRARAAADRAVDGRVGELDAGARRAQQQPAAAHVAAADEVAREAQRARRTPRAARRRTSASRCCRAARPRASRGQPRAQRERVAAQRLGVARARRRRSGRARTRAGRAA